MTDKMFGDRPPSFEDHWPPLPPKWRCWVGKQQDGQRRREPVRCSRHSRAVEWRGDRGVMDRWRSSGWHRRALNNATAARYDRDELMSHTHKHIERHTDTQTQTRSRPATTTRLTLWMTVCWCERQCRSEWRNAKFYTTRRSRAGCSSTSILGGGPVGTEIAEGGRRSHSAKFRSAE